MLHGVIEKIKNMKFKKINNVIYSDNDNINYDDNDSLKQGSASFLCKGPDSKYFRLCRSHKLLQLLNPAVTVKKWLQTIYKMNQNGGVTIKRYL